MDRQEIDKLARHLHNTTPLLGTIFRRRACRKLAEDGSAAATPLLVNALISKDNYVRSTAGAGLRSLKDPAAVDALCESAITNPAGPAASIVKERDYQPQSVSRRCVLFLLTGQLERYFDLDYDFQHLRAEYRAGDERLRQRIGEVIRRSGDARLVELFTEGRRRKLASELTEREAAIVIDVHARNRQWAEIFALLFHVPLSSTVAALDVIRKSGWQPENEMEAVLLKELSGLRQAIGAIPEKPPAPEVTLGPVMAKWIEGGRNGPMAKQPETTLRKALTVGPPPEAVAALAVLATAGKTTVEDIEAARTHKHWLVRLACLALCEIAPQFAYSESPTGGEGGGMWIDRLAPAILDAAVYSHRPISLNPDQLGALQASLVPLKTNEKRQKDGGRLACGNMLETLARHRLRHTIEVDEQMRVEFGETAIEVEG